MNDTELRHALGADNINSESRVMRMIEDLRALQAERDHIAAVLARFWEAAPMTLSSIQPILDLARQLNPRLR